MLNTLKVSVKGVTTPISVYILRRLDYILTYSKSAWPISFFKKVKNGDFL